jgi:hypothetical protein
MQIRTGRFLALSLAVMLGGACGDDDGGAGDDDDDTNDDGGGGDDDDDGGGGGRIDGGDDEFDDGGGTNASCKLVDMIIAVDGSSSMTEELVAIRDEVFPAFATRLIAIADGLDNFRVGTIDACPDPANYHTQGNGGACNFSGGQVWIDSSSPVMQAEFACVGDIYLADQNCSGDNDDEQPASAAAASLEPPYSTGANAGFSREDALLVVLAITDEDEQPTGGANSAQDVFDRLVATKGDVRRIVFVGIGGETNCDDGTYGSAEQANKLRAVTDLFIDEDRGVWKDLCTGQLEDGLDEAFAVIENACEELPQVP